MLLFMLVSFSSFVAFFIGLFWHKKLIQLCYLPIFLAMCFMVYVNSVEKSMGTYIYGSSFLLPFNPVTTVIYVVSLIYSVCVGICVKRNLPDFLDQVALHFTRAANLQYKRHSKRKRKFKK